MSTAMHAALAEAKVRRAEVAEKLESATRAVERGRRAHEAAVAENSRLEAAEGEWIDREAKRLQAAYADGHHTPPALVADPKAQQARTSALVNVRARAAALEELVADQQIAQQELAAAEQAVRAEEVARETALVRRLDAKRTQLLQELDVVTEMIAVVMLDSPGAVPPDVDHRCNVPVNVLTIELALQQSLHIVRDINTPRGTRHEQIAAARERLQQFREKPDDSAPATERAA